MADCLCCSQALCRRSWHTPLLAHPTRQQRHLIGVAAISAGRAVHARRTVPATPLYTLQTRHQPAQRLAYKRQLFASLYKRNFDRDTLRHAFRLMDWLLRVPPPERHAFAQYVRQHEEEHAMTYITSYEEYVREELTEKGIEEGQARVVLHLLERKLGALPADLTAQVQARHGEQFMALAESLLDFTDVADLTAWLAAHPPAAPEAEG